ncbi:hypothetical protein Y032_0618g707 [Ancylostoma ceylanicum]|nr:hypothetical protein Y032_0618g707 [Ancylostoma ceylanicum]
MGDVFLAHGSKITYTRLRRASQLSASSTLLKIIGTLVPRSREAGKCETRHRRVGALVTYMLEDLVKQGFKPDRFHSDLPARPLALPLSVENGRG